MEQFCPNQYFQNYKNSLPEDSSLKTASDHQLRVSALCEACSEHTPNQHVNHTLTNKVTKAQAELRARMQLEETLELLHGMGIKVTLAEDTDVDIDLADPSAKAALDFKAEGEVCLETIIDGLVDQSVIGNGTASMFGINLQMFTEAVDMNNLLKFAPGHYFREDGKLVKPEGHPKPDFNSLLPDSQTFETTYPKYSWSSVVE